jgi:hypothetical protein
MSVRLFMCVLSVAIITVVSIGFFIVSCNNTPNDGSTSVEKTTSNATSNHESGDIELGVKSVPVFQILIGIDNRAKIVNCGCGGDEPLSISRKSAALKRLRIDGIPCLTIERSYLSHPGTKEARIANEYQNMVYVQVLEMWNCDVLLPAGRDLYCTRDEFVDIHKDTTIPIVLSNVNLKFEFDKVKK